MNPLLHEILRVRRPAGSTSELQFVSRYIDNLPGIRRDKYGNRLLLHPTSRVLVSVHTDTVHRMPGSQLIKCDGRGVVSLHKRERVSNCLGADDGAGVYAALCMIGAGVPVSYAFHRDEEIGGLGSAWLAANRPDIPERFDICIALDRKGTRDVIIEQCYGECCSLEFACALADALGFGHEPEFGSFTDSANYAHLIPECTNLSVGYAQAHTRLETLDTGYLERLIIRLCAIDWSGLPIVRNPAETGWKLDWFREDSWEYMSELQVGVTENTIQRREKAGKVPKPIKVVHSGGVYYTPEIVMEHLKFQGAEIVPETPQHVENWAKNVSRK